MIKKCTNHEPKARLGILVKPMPPSMRDAYGEFKKYHSLRGVRKRRTRGALGKCRIPERTAGKDIRKHDRSRGILR